MAGIPIHCLEDIVRDFDLLTKISESPPIAQCRIRTRIQTEDDWNCHPLLSWDIGLYDLLPMQRSLLPLRCGGTGHHDNGWIGASFPQEPSFRFRPCTWAEVPHKVNSVSSMHIIATSLTLSLLDVNGIFTTIRTSHGCLRFTLVTLATGGEHSAARTNPSIAESFNNFCLEVFIRGFSGSHHELTIESFTVSSADNTFIAFSISRSDNFTLGPVLAECICIGLLCTFTPRSRFVCILVFAHCICLYFRLRLILFGFLLCSGVGLFRVAIIPSAFFSRSPIGIGSASPICLS